MSKERRKWKMQRVDASFVMQVEEAMNRIEREGGEIQHLQMVEGLTRGTTDLVILWTTEALDE